MADFLLIHGMNVGAWEWERVVPALQADPRTGKVVALEMPGRAQNMPGHYAAIRLHDYVETALAALRDHDLHDVVLVGHSGGGVTLQALAAAAPERVRRIVFLCAAIPKRGHRLLDWQPLHVRLISRLMLWLLRAKRRGVVPNRRLARLAMCHDLEPEDCDPVIGRLVPEPLALLVDRIDWNAAQMRAPVTYINTTHDRIIRTKDQIKMARSVPGIEIVPLESGHIYPVMYPERLVDILLERT